MESETVTEDVEETPVIEQCDTDRIRKLLKRTGITIKPGNTEYEQWRATHKNANAVAYDEKIVIQGSEPAHLESVIKRTDDITENCVMGRHTHCYFDGASRGNPGPAAIGCVIITDNGVVAENNGYIGHTTNNRAEYEALIHVLEMAHERGYSTVTISGDSKLVVKQVREEWDVNDDALSEYRTRVHELLDGFDDWSLEHIPREENEHADRIANETFESR